jgi:RTX toxin RtxA
MLGVGNIATKVGDGDVIVGMFGVGIVLTQVGNGMTAGLMESVGANFLTKVGNGSTLAEPLTLPVEKSVKTLAPAKRYRIELPEPSLG